MKIVLQGDDWTQINDKDIEGIVVRQFREEIENSEDKFSLEYFERYASLFGHEPSAFNLGIYQTAENNKEVLKSTKYVGIVPLMKKKKEEEEKDNKKELSVIKISSRFGISPTEMIKEVLSGDDYYENPDMLKTKSYSETEWRQLSTKVDIDNEKVLFGLINGIGLVDLFGNSDGTSKAANTDVGLADAYGVFEIIDFVNKAKEVCKKNLKRQSQRVEENLDCKVKGRILIQKQIKHNVSRGQNQKTYCSYNKMSDDIRENQIIKYALHLCQKNHGIGDSLAEDIRFCMNTLSGVPLKKCSVSDFIGLKNNGAFRQYKETLNAAKKVIGRYSISYSGQKNDEESATEPKVELASGKVLPYFIDMNLLFEYYCRAIFKKAIENFNASNKESEIEFELESIKEAKRILFPVTDDYWNKYVVDGVTDQETDNEIKLQKFFMPQYIPDIVITYRTQKDDLSKVAAVFDAKYSDVEKQEKRSRTHQVMFYMKALGCEYGGLISPYTGKSVDKEFYDSLSINHSVKMGNPTSNVNGKTMLFYIPLSSNLKEEKMFASYVEIVKGYLKIIFEGIEKKQKRAANFQEILDMVDDKKMDSLKKKEEMIMYIKKVKSKIEDIIEDK